MSWLSRVFPKQVPPTIFVQIACYRDPECQWTVKDLFAKADYPERITVGICWQFDPDADKHCFVEPSPRPQQMRVSSCLPGESGGVCWARAEVQKMFQDEDYVLMIDSHMRFVPGWDTALVREIKRCGSEKSLLSTYPPGYTPPNQLTPSPGSVVMRAQPMNAQGDIRFKGEVLAKPLKKPLRGAFLAGGFIFAPGRFVREVPTDPYLYFDQEEITLAARAFTHGWDVFAPSGIYLYHYYHEPVKGEKRPTHWADNPQWGKLAKISRIRYNWLMRGITPASPSEVLIEIDKYSLGKERSLKAYETLSGINFQEGPAINSATPKTPVMLQAPSMISDIARYLNQQKPLSQSHPR